jgi:hypothetical protein
MCDDQRWMYDGWQKNKVPSDEWVMNAQAFVDHAFSISTCKVVKCPCSRCRNFYCQKKLDMAQHLYRDGFMPNYEVWSKHGELCSSNVVMDETNSYVDDKKDEMVEQMEHHVEEMPGPEVQEFHRLLSASHEQLHEHTNVSVLAAVTRLMSIKSK